MLNIPSLEAVFEEFDGLVDLPARKLDFVTQIPEIVDRAEEFLLQRLVLYLRYRHVLTGKRVSNCEETCKCQPTFEARDMGRHIVNLYYNYNYLITAGVVRQK